MAMSDIDLTQAVSITDEEDEETLAAIDRGIQDADQGRLVTADEARKRLSRWNTKSSTPTPR